MKFDFKSGVAGQLSVVSSTGKLNFPAQTCKDYAKEGITYSINPDWAEMLEVYKIGIKGQATVDRPMFVAWTNADTAERNATKFTQIMNQMETIMQLTPTVAYPVDTGKSVLAAPFVAEADSWWMKSPIASDAYMLLMRLSIAMRMNEPLEEFVERICAITKHEKFAISRDAGYLRNAKKKGSLAGLLEKSLPCFNREGYSDWLLSRHERGFSCYDSRVDKQFPMDEESLLKRF